MPAEARDYIPHNPYMPGPTSVVPETSTPRTRSRRLGRALQGTNELAREAARDAFTNALDIELNRSSNLPPRPHFPSPINNRRRRRSPSDHDRRPDEDETGRGGYDRPKRRRLDLDESPAPRKSIKYGHYGQVEAGKLKMELVSCDGGEHVDPRSPGTYLGAKNLLRHDRSVYCSARKSSNIILQHADDMPFCLEELHIVGPEHGFTAPVREGLVYVAMTLRDLQKYLDPPPHARLQGVHTPPYHIRRAADRHMSLHSSPERLSLSDALRDPIVNEALNGSRDPTLPTFDPFHGFGATTTTATEDRHYRMDYGSEPHCELPALIDGPDEQDQTDDLYYPTAAAPVTLLSDEDEGPEDRTSADVLEFRLSRVRLMRRRLEAETYDREDRLHGLQGLHFDANDRDRRWFRDRHLSPTTAGSRFYPPAPPSLPAHRAGGGGGGGHPHPLLRPDSSSSSALPSVFGRSNATGSAAVTQGVESTTDPSVRGTRFRIKAEKHKVGIRFSPGLSGRFILLKCWAFEGSGNVDVQSVIAKGYGGCRFFPSRGVR